MSAESIMKTASAHGMESAMIGGRVFVRCDYLEPDTEKWEIAWHDLTGMSRGDMLVWLGY